MFTDKKYFLYEVDNKEIYVFGEHFCSRLGYLRVFKTILIILILENFCFYNAIDEKSNRSIPY